MISITMLKVLLLRVCIKYESPTYHGFKARAKVKVFQKLVKFKGHKVKQIMVPCEMSYHKKCTFVI